ncbi:MAG: hypothetical protein Sapg2KO_27700 [Saprospiraceae bacterium]
MKISRFELDSIEIELIAKAIWTKQENDYINKTDDMIIIAAEKYKFRTNSAQLNMIVVKKDGPKSHIDIIGAAGGIGIFNINFGAESNFIYECVRLLKAYCSQNGINLKEKDGIND